MRDGRTHLSAGAGAQLAGQVVASSAAMVFPLRRAFDMRASERASVRETGRKVNFEADRIAELCL